jgi:hypothetical protein
MTRILTIAMTLSLLAGCSKPVDSPTTDIGPPLKTRDQTPLQAATAAKDGLLELMRSDTTIFDGADPERFAIVPVKQVEPLEFSWGAFKIHLKTQGYSAEVGFNDGMRFYDGEFLVSETGRWVAQPPNVTELHNAPKKK